jgi:hypothetical protein
MHQFVESIARTLLLLAIVALLLVGAAPAAAQEAGDRWIASVAAISGITFQDWEGDAESVVCRDCTLPDPFGREEPLRAPVDGDDRDVTPMVGANFELMTPELPLPGTPRVFLAGEIAGAFGTERKIAQDGEPGTVGSPAPEGSQDQTPFGDDVAIGQGSEVVATMQEIAYGAYLGVAFPIELYGRTLRIKPALAWIRYEVEIEGLIVDADCRELLNRTECNPNPPLNGFLRETRLPASDTEAFDGLGPSLDIEMDTGRMGPLGTSIFLGARVYRMLGDQDVELRSGPIAFDDQLGQDEAAARYRFEVDDWMYRIGIGLRFAWLGFER